MGVLREFSDFDAERAEREVTDWDFVGRVSPLAEESSVSGSLVFQTSKPIKTTRRRPITRDFFRIFETWSKGEEMSSSKLSGRSSTEE